MGHINYHKGHALRAPRKGMRRTPKSEMERKKNRRRRVKHAKALDRRRRVEVEGKYGYQTYHQCTSKRYYKDKRSAGDALLLTQAVFGGTYYAYHCPLCGGWHLSTHDLGELNEAFGSS